MEEVKTYHQNLAVAFYDYKEAYDKIHNHWMLRLYKGIRIPGNVITLRSFLRRKWKTRLEFVWDNHTRKERCKKNHNLFAGDLKVYQMIV